MDLSRFKTTNRTKKKRVGRGGKRGTTSGAGTKGQKSRSGKGIPSGFRGGDNRIWQLFPKQRGASSRAGNKSPHRKHRYARFPRKQVASLNLKSLGAFKEGETVSPASLAEKGLIGAIGPVKILGVGTLDKKLIFENVQMSASAKSAIEKAGGTIQ